MNTTPIKDERHVYSAYCSWNGHIKEVSVSHGIPACPHCGSPLFEMLVEQWDENVKRYAEKTNDPEYPNFMKWLNKRICSPMRTQDQFLKLRREFDQLPKNND